MKAIASALVCATLTVSPQTHAQVFRCVDEEGHTVFSDTSCGTYEEKVEIVQSSGGGSTRRASCEPAELGCRFSYRAGRQFVRTGAPLLLTPS